MVEQCLSQRKICPKTIELHTGDTQTTWHLLRRMAKMDHVSGQGEIEHPIDTTNIAADFIFKQSSPRAVADQFSQVELAGVKTPFHSCEQCTLFVRGYLQELSVVSENKDEQ